MTSKARMLAVGGLAYFGCVSAYAAEKVYSPFTDADYPHQVYWGDTHLHTTNSLDAVMSGVSLDPEQAYRFARGDEVVASSGINARLIRPLDFLVIADHAASMGMFDQLLKGNPLLLKDPELRELRDSIKKGMESQAEWVAVIDKLGTGSDPGAGPLATHSARTVLRSVWEQYIETADRYNDPGHFTALIGYEWSPTTNGNKIHRVLVHRGDSSVAGQLMPFTAWDSIDPRDLWKFMQRYEDETGDQVLALAHNGNVSNGQMFPVEINPHDGSAIDAEYVKTRARWEPLYEVTQYKGDGEAHPFLSPTDEFADFETWDRGNIVLSAPKAPDMLQYEYAREALKNGLKLGDTLGTNPYQFGMVGSTDSHTSLATADEGYYFSTFASGELGTSRLKEPMVDFPVPNPWMTWETSASGYAAVWATENTREAIWDAMQRREVYATTGPRITLRFFGGWDFSESDASGQVLASVGYRRGVPMGGTLQGSDAKQAPTFLVGAIKDPMSGHLDRLQIVKGWIDSDGNTHEKIYDVVWGDAHLRRPDEEGRLPAVGNTVNVAEASWTNSIGDAELTGFWQDPDFDASESAVYYVRVLEIPTPRWTAYDAKYTGEEPLPGTTMTLQERAYSSPIWYRPKR